MNFCFSHQIKLKWTFLARHTSNKMSNLNVAFEESNIIKLNRITIFRIKSTNIKFYNFNQLVKSNQIIKLIFNNQIKSIKCSLGHHNILFKYVQIIWILKKKVQSKSNAKILCNNSFSNQINFFLIIQVFRSNQIKFIYLKKIIIQIWSNFF